MVQQIAGPAFSGSITLLIIDQCAEPFFVQLDGLPYCVVDTGYSWLQQFPSDTNHTVTTMFDADGTVVQWYIDICKRHGVDERGMPWFDDLYLDVVVAPHGTVALLDAEELESARRQGLVSLEDYNLAWREARHLLAAIAESGLPALTLAPAHRAILLERLPAPPHVVYDGSCSPCENGGASRGT